MKNHRSAIVVAAAMLTVLATLAPGTFRADAASGLIVGYGLDAGSGTTAIDASGNGLTGTLHGTTWTTGKYGGALSFNGSSSYVDVGNPSALQLTGSATWSAWVFATANPRDDGLIVAKSQVINGWQFKTSPDAGTQRFAIGITAPDGTWVQRNSGTIRALNTWYYVAGVYDATARTLDVYVNGVLDDGPLTSATAAVPTIPSSQVNNASASVNVGRRSDAGYYFSGIIDEVRVYGRALSASEVQTDMNTPLTAPSGTATPTPTNTPSPTPTPTSTATPTGGDTQRPTAPPLMVLAAVGGNQMKVSWPASTDNVGVTGYLLERCQGGGCGSFTQIATPLESPYTDTGLSPFTSYTYRVRATDAAGNVSDYSSATSASTGALDTQPPTAPGTLTAAVTGSNQINLSWSASTDDVAVTGYLLERCAGAGCSNFAQIATSTATSFNDTGLATSTSYSYRVRAADAASNVSAYSTVVSATTAAPDTQVPTTPGAPVASVIGSGQINLSWPAATDNVAVTGYLLERCGGAGCSDFVQIASPAVASFKDIGLAPATSYTYRVRASDAASNLSDYSSIGTGITPARALAAPSFVTETHSATDGCCGLQFNNASLTLNVSGSNRLLLAAWHSEWDGVPDPNREQPDPGAWSVSNNGVPGTEIVNTNGYKGPNRFRIYYWLNPPLGTNTITVSNPNTGANELSVSAMLFTNVNQTNPLGDIALDVSTNDRTGESETVGTSSPDLVVHVIADALFYRGNLGPGETAISMANDGTKPQDGDASLWVSTKPGADSTTTVSSSDWWLATVMNGAAIVLHGSLN